MKAHGFTLIECLISISLLTLLALLATQFGIQSYNSLDKLRTHANSCMMHNAAFDLLSYDVKHAPEIKTWASKDKENSYTWKQGNDTITWFIKGDTLMRKSGKRSSVVAPNIASLKIAEHKAGYIVSLAGKGNDNSIIEQVIRVIR